MRAAVAAALGFSVAVIAACAGIMLAGWADARRVGRWWSGD